MPNPVEFDITVGALPEGLDTDPQGLLEAFAERLFIAPTVPWSSFTLGAATPTSDLGPWFKNGQEVYVWDDGLATYIPQVIGDVALGYVVASLDPGASGYKLWFDTTADSIKHSNGAIWTAMYADRPTLTVVNAAIAAAISGITIVAGTSAFSARPSVQQDVVFGGAGTQSGVVALGTEDFDPDGAFAASAFTAPATGYYQFNYALEVRVTGVVTELDITTSLAVGGTEVHVANQLDGGETVNGGIFTGSAFIYLNSGNVVDLRYEFVPNGAITVSIYTSNTRLSGYRVR